MSGLSWSEAARAQKAAGQAWVDAVKRRDEIARAIATAAILDPVVPDWARRAFMQAQRDESRAQRALEDAEAQRQEVADTKRAERETRARQRVQVDAIAARLLERAS